MKTKHYDVVIVGVGAAGAVFAKQLSQAGLKVLGIEFGKYFPNHIMSGRLTVIRSTVN